MSKSKEYKAIKNYIHNELGLTKEDIREAIVPIIKKEVKRVFENTYGRDSSIEDWIRCMVSDEIKRRCLPNMIPSLCKEVLKEQLSDKLLINIKVREE